MTQLILDMAEGQSFFRTSGDLAVALGVSLAGLVVNLAMVTAGIMIV
jgi:hypothetical protein